MSTIQGRYPTTLNIFGHSALAKRTAASADNPPPTTDYDQNHLTSKAAIEPVLA